MKTEAEIRVIKLLEGGRALSQEQRRDMLERLDDEELAALRRIANGRLAVEDPRIQRRAVSALGMLRERPAAVRTILRELVNAPDPKVAVRAIQAIGREPPAELMPELRALVREPGSHPGSALAAARVIASMPGQDTIDDLQDLRRRFLALVPDERSPSILVLDMLLQKARGESRPPSPGDDQKPVA